MASSGNFQNTFRTGYTLRVEWKTNSQSIDNNSSSITVTAYLVSSGSSYIINSSASKTIKLTINGTTYSKSAAGLANLTGGQKKSLFAKTVTIAHASDGSKSVAISCSFGIDVTLSGTKFDTVKASGTAVLNTIPRATTPTTSGTFNVGGTVTINTPRASSAFTHTLQYSVNNAAFVNIATDVGTSYSWTLPSALATATPGAKTGTVRIRCITYSGSTNIGNKTISRTFNITSAYAAPSVTLTASQTNAANISNRYIRGQSSVTLKATASLKYSAKATQYVFTYGSSTKTITSTSGSASVTFTLPANATESYKCFVKLTDSRGYTAEANQVLLTMAYSAPKLSSLTALRGDYDGTTFTENSKGNSLRIGASVSVTDLVKANASNYKIEYRLSNQTAYTTLVDTKASGTYSGYILEHTDAIFSENASYVIRFSLSDSFDTVSQIVDVPSQKVLLNFSANGKAMAIGGIANTDDALEIMMGLYATGGIKPITLATGTNLDEIVKTGLYVGSMNTQDMLNSPMDTGSFTLEVTSAGTSGQLMQRYSYCHKTIYRAFVRFMYEGSWGAWQPAEGFITFSIGTHAGRVRFANGFLIQWGRVSITPTAAGTITEKVIKFPVAYTSSPICQVSANSAAPSNVTCSYTADADELTLCMTRTNTTATYISWTSFGISI